MPVGMANKLEGIPPQVEEWHPPSAPSDPGKLAEYRRFLAERRAAEDQARKAHEQSLSRAIQESRQRSPLSWISPGMARHSEAWKRQQRIKFQKGIVSWRREEQRKFFGWLETDYKAPRPPSIAEQLVAFFTGWQQQEQRQMFESRTIDPLHWQRIESGAEAGKFVAGAVGSGESLVYSVGRLAGFETPSIPPSVVGASIKAGVSQVTKGKADVSEFEEMSFGYAAGSVYGEILLGLGIGKVASKTFQVAKQAVPSAIKFKTGGWLLKHSSWYKGKVAKKLAPQIIGTEHYGSKTAFSLGKAKASEVAWSLALTPKSSMVGISKVPEIAVKGRVLPHLFARGGQVSVGFLKELSFQKPTLGGLFSEEKIITQLVKKPALRKLPYIPSLLKTGKAVSPFVVAPHGWFEEEKPKKFAVFVPKFKAPQRITQFQELKQPTIIKEIPLTKVWQPIQAKVKSKTKLVEVQVQKQKVVTVSKGHPVFEFQPRASRGKSPDSVFWLPKPKRKKKGKSKRGFAWQFRVHKVAEPEQILGMNLQKNVFRGWKP